MIGHKKSKTKTSADSEYGRMFESVRGLAESLRDIQELGISQYTPVVEQIIATRSRDVRHIEHTLDYLLDFACHPQGLILFKSLCRHYYAIDPTAAVEYVNAYREMWDTDPDKEPVVRKSRNTVTAVVGKQIHRKKEATIRNIRTVQKNEVCAIKQFPQKGRQP